VKIRKVAITARHLPASAAFYRDVLQMPVVEHADRVTVRIGSSELILTRAEMTDGVHHLAFGIAPNEFDSMHQWLNQRVDIITVNGSQVVDGPETWNSQSLYFLGPEDILLEFIARQADIEVRGNDGDVPQPLSISEIGIGVVDVAATARELTTTLGLPTFPPQLPRFAPIGSHDGLLIVADQQRPWFPTFTHRPAQGRLTALINAPTPQQLNLADNITVSATA